MFHACVSVHNVLYIILLIIMILAYVLDSYYKALPTRSICESFANSLTVTVHVRLPVSTRLVLSSRLRVPDAGSCSRLVAIVMSIHHLELPGSVCS